LDVLHYNSPGRIHVALIAQQHELSFVMDYYSRKPPTSRVQFVSLFVCKRSKY